MRFQRRQLLRTLSFALIRRTKAGPLNIASPSAHLGDLDELPLQTHHLESVSFDDEYELAGNGWTSKQL
jgi:hypothetical protein